MCVCVCGGGKGVTFYKITEEPESDKQYWSDKIMFVYTEESRNLIRRKEGVRSRSKH